MLLCCCGQRSVWKRKAKGKRRRRAKRSERYKVKDMTFQNRRNARFFLHVAFGSCKNTNGPFSRRAVFSPLFLMPVATYKPLTTSLTSTVSQEALAAWCGTTNSQRDKSARTRTCSRPSCRRALPKITTKGRRVRRRRLWNNNHRDRSMKLPFPGPTGCGDGLLLRGSTSGGGC